MLVATLRARRRMAAHTEDTQLQHTGRSRHAAAAAGRNNIRDETRHSLTHWHHSGNTRMGHNLDWQPPHWHTQVRLTGARAGPQVGALTCGGGETPRAERPANPAAPLHTPSHGAEPITLH